MTGSAAQGAHISGATQTLVGRQKPAQQQFPAPHSAVFVHVSVPPPELAALATAELAAVLEADEDELLEETLEDDCELDDCALEACELDAASELDVWVALELLVEAPPALLAEVVPKSLVVPSAQFRDHRAPRPMKNTLAARFDDIGHQYLFSMQF